MAPRVEFPPVSSRAAGATVSFKLGEEASHGLQRPFVPILVCDRCRVTQNALL